MISILLEDNRLLRSADPLRQRMSEKSEDIPKEHFAGLHRRDIRRAEHTIFAWAYVRVLDTAVPYLPVE